MKFIILFSILLIINYSQAQCDGCVNGSCLNSFCYCNDGYAGSYCNIQVNNTLPININYGPNLYAGEFVFSLGILRERDYHGFIILEYNLRCLDYNQTYPGMVEYDLDGKGRLRVDRFVSNSKQNISTGINYLSVYNNTVIYTVQVTNYQFTSFNNSLEIIFIVNGYPYCNQYQLPNSLTLNGNNNLIYAQFPNNLYVDYRQDYSHPNIISSGSYSSYSYGIRIPYFTSFAMYQAIVTSYQSGICDPSSSTNGTTGTYTTGNNTTTGSITTYAPTTTGATGTYTTGNTSYTTTGSITTYSPTTTTTSMPTTGTQSTTTYSPTTSTTSPNGDQVETSTTTTSTEYSINTTTYTTRYSSNSVSYITTSTYSDGYSTKTISTTTIVNYSGPGSVTTTETNIRGTVVSTNTSTQKRFFKYIHGYSNLQNLESTPIEDETSDSSKLLSNILFITFAILLILC